MARNPDRKRKCTPIETAFPGITHYPNIEHPLAAVCGSTQADLRFAKGEKATCNKCCMRHDGDKKRRAR